MLQVHAAQLPAWQEPVAGGPGSCTVMCAMMGQAALPTLMAWKLGWVACSTQQAVTATDYRIQPSWTAGDTLYVTL